MYRIIKFFGFSLIIFSFTNCTQTATCECTYTDSSGQSRIETTEYRGNYAADDANSGCSNKMNNPPVGVSNYNCRVTETGYGGPY